MLNMVGFGGNRQNAETFGEGPRGNAYCDGLPCSNNTVPISLAAGQFQGGPLCSPSLGSRVVSSFCSTLLCIYFGGVKRGSPMEQRILFGSSVPLHIFEYICR